MEITVLGPLSVRDQGEEAVPTAPKPRQLLSVLLLSDSRPVPSSSLITELWGSSPPQSAKTTLQTYVAHLRRELARRLSVPAAVVSKHLLRTTSAGYEFNSTADYFDLREFRRLDLAAREALRIGDNRTAVDLLCQALGLWQGSALMDVEHGPVLNSEVVRLERAWMSVAHRYMKAEIDIGRHRELLSELAALVVRFPLVEELHMLFMVALNRSGHRARALEVFSVFSRSLLRDLETRPSPEMRRLHDAILAAEWT